jgi:hydroxymethylglutaryl-CoA reductase (NADPH)
MSDITDRVKNRLEMDETDEAFGGLKSAYLEVFLNNAAQIGKVMDLSEHGLRARLNLELDKVPSAGSLLHNVNLGTAMSRQALSRLVVRRVTPVDDQHVDIGLEGEDEETRASLWRVWHDLQTVKEAEDYTTEIPAKLPVIPARGHYTEKARQERIQFIRDFTDKPLSTLDETRFDAEKLTGNIENFIGSLDLPVGLAGPLWFNGANVRGPVYAPMATSEGALVASATRGATAISRSGGVTTRVLRQVMMRVPLFVLNTSSAASKFRHWIEDHFEEIVAQTRLVSRHARLRRVTPDQVGNRVNITFSYETGDAAGQNMTTSCTWKACQWILSQLQHFPEIVVENFVVDGNMSGDKKVNFQSFLTGRGTRVTAEAMITKDVLERILKVSARQLEDAQLTAMSAGIHIGTIGYNVNIANVIGAMFTACGQDIACVHESSLGIFRLQAHQDDIHIIMDLPALIVGTVGGGTSLAAQADYLEMIGCKGVHKSGRLAEIIAGYCLALDLSTASAIASGQFASAHDRLGRNRPVEWFTLNDLSPEFFQRGFKRFYDDQELVITDTVKTELEIGSSIITEMTSRKVEKMIGLIPRRIHYKKADGTEGHDDVVIKIKPTDTEVIHVANTVAQMCGGHLASAHEKNKHRTGLKECHTRELAIYKQTDPRFKKYIPKIYDCYLNAEREAYVVVMEDISNLELMNTADDVNDWTDAHIKAAIKGISQTHALTLGQEDNLRMMPWIGHVMTPEDMLEMTPLWRALVSHAGEEFPEWFQEEDIDACRRIIQNIDCWYKELETMPRCMVHNDFNPRNIGFRRDGDELTLCAYDWELATINIPQRDLAELLSFTLHGSASKESINTYVEYHRTCLEEASGQSFDPEQWRRGFIIALHEFTINRVCMYLMSHTFRNYKFLERVVRSVRNMASFFRDEQ